MVDTLCVYVCILCVYICVSVPGAGTATGVCVSRQGVSGSARLHYKGPHNSPTYLPHPSFYFFIFFLFSSFASSFHVFPISDSSSFLLFLLSDQLFLISSSLLCPLPLLASQFLFAKLLLAIYSARRLTVLP